MDRETVRQARHLVGQLAGFEGRDVVVSHPMASGVRRDRIVSVDVASGEVVRQVVGGPVQTLDPDAVVWSYGGFVVTAAALRCRL